MREAGERRQATARSAGRLLGPALAVLALCIAGAALDRMRPASQPALFLALLAASLLGAGGALVWRGSRLRGAVSRLAGLALALLAWRVAYFPIMVFSGHVASIGEWLSLLAGLPVLIYPVFLLAVAVLHALAGIAAGWLLTPPHPLLRFAALGGFTLATLVSFSTPADLVPLPDRSLALDEPVPAPRAPARNPYLTRLDAPGHTAPQRVLLLAAGLTYATIPDTPWARTVKGVLEGQFEARPVAPTRSRVEEHYLAYRSAQRMIGCRAIAACPPKSPIAPPDAP